MTVLYTYSILFALCASSYAALDYVTFQNVVLERLNTLERTVAAQNGVITAQQTAIDSLLNTVLSKKEGYQGIINRPNRFVMDVSDGPVAFSAAISARFVEHMGRNETILFPVVLTDIGGGYNNATGVFTAPLTGIYMISCSLLDHMEGVHGTAMLHAEIVQNDKVIGRVFAHGEATYRDQGSQTVFVQVNQGDRIFVRSMDNNDLSLGGEMYSSFSGYLMTQL